MVSPNRSLEKEPSILERINEGVYQIERVIVVISLLVMSVVVFASVVYRRYADPASVIADKIARLIGAERDTPTWQSLQDVAGPLSVLALAAIIYLGFRTASRRPLWNRGDEAGKTKAEIHGEPLSHAKCAVYTAATVLVSWGVIVLMFGTGSVELHDQVRRLDRQLAWFLDSLASVVPPGRTIISLTADHGVQEYPEAGAGGRLSLAAERRALETWIHERWALDADVSDESGLLMANTGDLRRRGVDIDSIAAAIAGRLRDQPGVRDVFTPTSLARRADAEAMRWRRQLGPQAEWLVAVSLEPGWLFASGATSTSHGTTNLLDRRVPLIVRAPGRTPRQVDRVVGVVDLAPTVAALLGIAPTEPLDGTVLPEVVPPRR